MSWAYPVAFIVGVVVVSPVYLWLNGRFPSKQRPDLNPNIINAVDMEQVRKQKDEIASYPPHGFYTDLPAMFGSEMPTGRTAAGVDSGIKRAAPPVTERAAQIAEIFDKWDGVFRSPRMDDSYNPAAVSDTKQAPKPKRDKRGRYCK